MATAGDGPSRPERLHALDAVRGFALLLGIVYHAAVSFLPIAAGFWVIVDSHPSTTLAVFVFASHTFRMTTFFVVAGFFAHLSFHRLGATEFIRDRSKRIALPLAAGLPILMVLFVPILAAAAIVKNGGQLPAPPAASAILSKLSLAHLWFLYVLLELYVVALALRTAIGWLDRSGRIRAGADRAIRLLIRTGFAPVVLATPITLGFLADPTWSVWIGIPTPQHLITDPQAFVAYGTAFGFGWLLHRQPDLLADLRRWWAVNLVLAVVLIAGCVAIALGLVPSASTNGAVRLFGPVGYALAGWTATFAVIGLALRFLSGFSASRRYIADASYWLYLVHLPIVMALQVAVARLDWPWPVKFAGIVAVSFALGFASYQWLVRGSVIGAVLNGRRLSKPARSPRPVGSASRAGS